MAGGYIMQLQNFSVNDGDGIRTNIFLAGCPLRCAWCSNPEGQTSNNDMTCYMTTDEVVNHIKKQMIFYRNSGGGVTFTGGEATMQAEFLRELADTFYDMGIPLALETCGYFEVDMLADILKKMSLIFFDIKHIDEEKHIYYTSVSNNRILDNLAQISNLQIPLVIRIPVIHGVNTDIENLKQTFLHIKENAPNGKLELLPYHMMGEGKYEKLGMSLPTKDFSRPTEDELEEWGQLAQQMGIQTVSYK